MLRPIGRLLVSLFVVFHFTAVCIWLLAYTGAQHNRGTEFHPLLPDQEIPMREAVIGTGHTALQQLVTHYIDYAGLHQYWDFFAPDAPVSYRLLRVCTRVGKNTQPGHLQCPHPSYQSFSGDLDAEPASFVIDNSRDFRLVENLSRLNRPELYEQFLRYWLNNTSPLEHSAPATAYAVISTYGVRPGKQPVRTDEIVWLLTR